MSEDFGDKTEAPTPRRRLEAREQGQIARSTDLTAAVLLLGILWMLSAFGPALVVALRGLVRLMLSGEMLSDLSTAGSLGALLISLRVLTTALAPILAGVVVIAIVTNLAQVGLVFSGKRLQPNLEALNPIKGFSRVFGGGQGWMHFLMSLLKMTLVALVAYSA